MATVTEGFQVKKPNNDRSDSEKVPAVGMHSRNNGSSGESSAETNDRQGEDSNTINRTEQPAHSAAVLERVYSKSSSSSNNSNSSSNSSSSGHNKYPVETSSLQKTARSRETQQPAADVADSERFQKAKDTGFGDRRIIEKKSSLLATAIASTKAGESSKMTKSPLAAILPAPSETTAESSSMSSWMKRPTERSIPAKPSERQETQRKRSGQQRSLSSESSSSRAILPLLANHTPKSPAPTKSKSGSTLRRGKWTVEEETYVARVIKEFNSGFLNAPVGTTLRSYLSEKLQCDPMRITKKFTGDACIGKRVFHPAVRSATNAVAIDKAQAELDALERKWRRRLEIQQRDTAKKAAASAASAAASGRSHGFSPAGSADYGIATSLNGSQNVVTRTATWLDRASTVLKETGGSNTSHPVKHHQLQQPQPPQQAKREIENKMKEVQRLIHEGPFIQQTSAGIPQFLDPKETTRNTRIAATSPTTPASSTIPHEYTSSLHSGEEPADKRLRTGAEDAEALVGFLRSVRASASRGEA